jgi:glycosyltransferase involved in cell wall biosynthesis
MKLSFVLPTLNEEEAIGKVIGDIRKYLTGDVEIIVVDCSTDRTREIAESMGATVIDQNPRGHGHALRKGIAYSRGDIVTTSDCDDTYPIKAVPDLVRLVKEGKYDIISGNRIHRRNRSMPLSNRLGNILFAWLVRVLYWIPVSDVTTGMFVMNRRTADSIDWQTNLAFPAETIIKANRTGLRWRQMEIDYSDRVGAVTLNKFKSGKSYLRAIFGFRFRSREYMRKLAVEGKL